MGGREWFELLPPEGRDAFIAGLNSLTSSPAAAPPTGWGRAHLVRCGIDPDGEAAVRAALESCRESHGRWLWGDVDGLDAEAYYLLAGAIADLYGWVPFPSGWSWDWPPPIVMPMALPLRNTIAW